MSDWSQIKYREFWDVPRAVLAAQGADTYFIDSRFDEATDHYLGHYEVWRLPKLSADQINGSWVGLEKLALERLPNVGLRDLPFKSLLGTAPIRTQLSTSPARPNNSFKGNAS